MRTLKYLRTFEATLAKAGFGPIAGVDEAGRGACAGPITIAACCLPAKPIAELAQLTDSKKLSAIQRARLYPVIQKHALAWSIVHIDATEIDRREVFSMLTLMVCAVLWRNYRYAQGIYSLMHYVSTVSAPPRYRSLVVTVPRVVLLQLQCWRSIRGIS